MDSHISASYRRRELKLPERRWHALGAFTLIAATGVSLAAIAIAPSPKIDRNIAGEFSLPPMPQPLAYTNLNADGEALPDLLAGDVPEGDNPTETTQTETDALGNPVSSDTAEDTLTSPKTITINGNNVVRPQVPLFPELTKAGPFGRLPTKARNGNSPLKAYSRNQTIETNKNGVALIIGGLGVNAPLTDLAIRSLPANVTLSFAAHSDDLQNWINIARADGHEVLLEIPMESQIFDPLEPGASRSLKVNNRTQNEGNLDWLLSRAQGYFGVINFNGDKFLRRADASAEALTRFSESGLGFITDGAFDTPSLKNLARTSGLPFKQGLGLIDPEPQPAIIEIELRRLAAVATSGSKPVGVGFAYPETIQSVNNWIDTLPEQSLQLVPASNLLTP